MYEEAVSHDLSSLQYVPHWLVTQKQIGRWYDDIEYFDDDELDKWHNGYKKRKAQRAKIRKELMPIAWHPSRWWDWCIPEHEKKRDRKIMDVNTKLFCVW